jgi:hypothetical protein
MMVELKIEALRDSAIIPLVMNNYGIPKYYISHIFLSVPYQARVFRKFNVGEYVE